MSIRKTKSPLEKLIGYRFRNAKLLRTALTHRSYHYEHRDEGPDNQRLEFLGDAVLELLVAEWVYNSFEEQPEGMLTVLRSRLTSTAALAEIAGSMELGRYLHLGHGEKISGGSNRESNLADVLEALLAALYLDGGMEAARRVFEKLFKDAIQSLKSDQWEGNPKGRLQAIAQRDYRETPLYNLISEEGEAHAPLFRVEVIIGELFRAEGSGSSKQAAQFAAAETLLRQLDAMEDKPLLKNSTEATEA